METMTPRQRYIVVTIKFRVLGFTLGETKRKIPLPDEPSVLMSEKGVTVELQ